ncbi:MAG: AI-2E family transporter [Patescibacteria group bacterium]
MQIEPKQTISIDSWTIVRSILFVLLFVFLYLIRDLILVILVAVVIASAIEPAINWFGKNKVPRVPAVIALYLVLAVAVMTIFYIFIPIFLEETVNLISASPQYLQTLEVWTSKTIGIDILKETSGGLSLSELASGARSISGGISGSVFNTLSSVFGGAFSLILIFVLSFYLAVQKNGISNFLRVITPYNYHKYVIDLWERSQNKIGKWMQGQLLLSLVIGMLVYLGLTILGVRNALLFAILAAVLEIIPIFGPILASIPAIAISYVDSGLAAALMVVGLYLIIQQFENHLLAPIVINKVVGVSPVLVILALIIGGQIAGFLGIILSVPMSAAIMELVNDIKARHRDMEDRERSISA